MSCILVVFVQSKFNCMLHMYKGQGFDGDNISNNKNAFRE